MGNYLLKITIVLTLLFGVTKPSIGQSNQYLHFDGIDDYVSLPNAAAALNGSNTITMAGWFYTDALVYGQGMMSIRGGGNGSGEMYIIQLGNGKLECRVVTTTGLKEYASPNNTIVAGTWQHIAWVFDVTSVKLYVNGVLQGSGNASGTFQSTDKPFTVGRCIASNFNFYFGGRSDEVSLWNKALSPAEIQDMMTNELTGTETGLVSYYKFNQGFPGGNNTSISQLIGEVGSNMNADLNNFTLNGATSNFNGTLQNGAQVISFPSVANQLTTATPLTLNAVASSGLAVSYTIISGPATVSGNTLTLDGTAGQVVVRASQAGDGTFTAAPNIDVNFEVLDPNTVLVNTTVLHPLAGNVYAPSLMPIQIAVRADIDYQDLFSVQNVSAQIGGSPITLSDHGNGFYTAWWTPPATGNHQLTIIGTNNHGVTSDNQVGFNLNTGATSVIATATMQAWVKDDIPVTIQESDLPSHIGAYDQIIGKLTIECPTGGCDPWDRVSHIEVQAKDGTWYEIVRYLTPYGIACNSEIDLTDFASLLIGKTKFRISLGTQGNGFLYTLKLEYRAGTPTHAYSKVHKLWNATYQFGDMANLQPYEILTAQLNSNTQAAKIKLVATGHGWGNNNTGNAAEFQRNKHHLWINGTTPFEHDNWNICNPNPDGCANQAGTWQYNRAGWCPGSIAQFFDYNVSNLIVNNKIDVAYKLDESYVDYCHPNNPNCTTATCPDCSDNFNPHLVTSSYLISFADAPTSGTVGLPRTNAATANLYPNPSTGTFYIDFARNVNAGSIVVYDIAGRVILTNTIAKGSNSINIRMPSGSGGVYVVAIQLEGEETVSKRIVIE